MTVYTPGWSSLGILCSGLFIGTSCPHHLKGSLAPATAALPRILQSGTPEAAPPGSRLCPAELWDTGISPQCWVTRHLDPKAVLLVPCIHLYVHYESQPSSLSQTRDDQTATLLRELKTLRRTQWILFLVFMPNGDPTIPHLSSGDHKQRFFPPLPQPQSVRFPSFPPSSSSFLLLLPRHPIIWSLRL